MAKQRLRTATTPHLERELQRRRAVVARQKGALQKRRSDLVEKLASVEWELRSLAGAVRQNSRPVRAKRIRRRLKNDTNLADSLNRLLANRVMTVTEAAEAVQKAGYRTTSPNFRIIVNTTLISDKRFKRVSRGRYTAK